MAWGREEFEWERFSHLMAVVFNTSIWDTSKTSPKQPRDFNPLRHDGESGPVEADDEAYRIVERMTDGEQGEH